jgi:hypothetical protein
MQTREKLGLQSIILRLILFILTTFGLIVLILANFHKGFFTPLNFKYYYLYIISLFFFLIMFRYNAKSLYCKKPSGAIMSLIFSIILYLFSPFFMQMLNIALFFASFIVIVASKEYKQARKAYKNDPSYNEDDLC